MSTTVTVQTGGTPVSPVPVVRPMVTQQSLGITTSLAGPVPIPPDQLVPILPDYSGGSIRLDGPRLSDAPYSGSVSMPRYPRLPFMPGDPWSADYPSRNLLNYQSPAQRAVNAFVYKEIPLTAIRQYMNPYTGLPNPQAHFRHLGHCPVYVPKQGLGTCIAMYSYHDGIPTLANAPTDTPTYCVRKLFPVGTIVGEEWLVAKQQTHCFLVPATQCKPMKWAIMQLPSTAPQEDDPVTIVSDNQGVFPIKFATFATVKDDIRYVEAQNAFMMDHPQLSYLFDTQVAPLDVRQRESMYQEGVRKYQERLDNINQVRLGIEPPSSSDDSAAAVPTPSAPPSNDDKELPPTTSNKNRLVCY